MSEVHDISHGVSRMDLTDARTLVYRLRQPTLGTLCTGQLLQTIVGTDAAKPRSRSPDRRGYRDRDHDRSRSPSRERDRRRRERSPINGHHESGAYVTSYPDERRLEPRSYEERRADKEAMVSSLRDSSQQDRRVYVGNLAYDVKWHSLKDFMRQGKSLAFRHFRQ